MLNTIGRRVFLATQPMDMRCGIHRLSAWVESHRIGDPFAGDVYVFVAKNRQRVKILIWDHSGYWLCLKYLQKGRFTPPAPPMTTQPGRNVQTMPLSAAELQMLLEGISSHDMTYKSHGRSPLSH